MLWSKLKNLNTLRNQMLVGFLAVMIVILLFVGIVTYNSVSDMLKNNAEKHFQQTAIQANGRLEAILEQIDSLTTQVATNTYIQKLLLDETNGKSAIFAERQALLPIVSMVQAYSSGVTSVELYNFKNQRIFPLADSKLESRVENSWIERANRGKGRLVWIGIDPRDSQSVLAMRQISLVDEGFSHGGYLLVRMDRDAFELSEPIAYSGDGEQLTMLIVDHDSRLITSTDSSLTETELAIIMHTDEQTVSFNGTNYILVKQRSAMTDWTLLLMNPVSAVTEGISVLRTAITVSAAVGTLLFVILSFVLSTMITRPIFKLIKTMRSTRLGILKPNPESPSSTIEINELNNTYNMMVEDMNGLIRLVYEKEILQSRMELKALQAQIDPHFLFNTLEMFYWSLQEKDEEELSELVVALSGLFRYTIGNPKKDEWVTIADELEHVERYLKIMKMRFGDRLTCQISMEPEFASVKIPKLIIQPLVENAIVHGIEGSIAPVSVSVTVSCSDTADHLIISVKDDGPGMDEEKLGAVVRDMQEGQSHSERGAGVGIANVHRRLKLNFELTEHHAYGIKVYSQKGKGTAVCFEIPLEQRRVV